MVYIGQQGIQAGQHGYSLKWMRYYLDFCRKYHFRQGTDASLAAFLKKLGEKNQPVQLQKQTEQAIWLYFALGQSLKKQQDLKDTGKTSHSTRISPNTYSKNIQEYNSLEQVYRQSEDSAGKKNTLKKKGADWTGAFAELNNCIRVRHYSRATLKTYTGWVRKFQAFTESKDPTLLDTEDVKAFLTSLAAKKKVFASTQNQAFNALLFFFRHVLGKEFGKVDGVSSGQSASPIYLWFSAERRLIVLQVISRCLTV